MRRTWQTLEGAGAAAITSEDDALIVGEGPVERTGGRGRGEEVRSWQLQAPSQGLCASGLG